MLRLPVAALLALALLAGCTSSPQPQATDNAPAASATAPSAATSEPIGSADVAFNAAQPATFQVKVPAGATEVVATSTFTEGSFTSLTVDLAGCGSGTAQVLYASLATAIGDIKLCGSPKEGEQTVTVSTDGQAVGTITISAKVPS